MCASRLVCGGVWRETFCDVLCLPLYLCISVCMSEPLIVWWLQGGGRCLWLFVCVDDVDELF